ncbi:MAG: AsmA family protein [Proteobacteria bacterium]|nr:AsmA family protein [Pseudomonadota bacterium]
MSPSTRKKLLIGGGGAVLLIVIALLAAPAFIDLNSYKPQIISEVKKATGRDLVIDGPVSLSLLPTPSVGVTGVRFFNMPGAKNPDMVEVKSVTVRPSLLALLTGNLAVREVVLDQPRIVLEINAEGKPNWEFTPSVADAKPVAPKPGSAKPLSLGALTFKDGTLIFSDSKAGLSVVAEKANLTASVGSIDGPYGLIGSATINGAPFTFDLDVGAKGSNGYATRAALAGGGGKVDFKGNLSALGSDARLAGTANVSAESLTGFVATLVGLAGLPPPALPPLLAGKFSFEGGVELSQTAFAAKDFKMRLGEDSGSGSIAVTLKPTLAVDGKLSIPKLNLDTWLAAMSQPATPAAGKAPGASTASAPPPPQSAAGNSLFATMNAKLAIDVGEITYNKQPVRNVALELEARNGVVAVPKLSATLPGDMQVTAKSTLSGDAAHPTASGDFSLVAPKLRETLNWLAVDTSSLPPDKLTRLSVKGRMTSSKGEVQVPDAAIELDALKATGGLTVSFSVPLSVVTHVELDTFDLDPFLAYRASQKPAGAPASSATAAPARKIAPPKAVGPSLGLKAKIGTLIYNKQPASDVGIDVAVQGGTLKLNDIKVSNFATARFALRGAVADFDTPAPQPDIAFNFEATDMTRVLQAVGATAPDNLGLVQASGGMSGNLERLTLKDLTVSAMGESVKANGVLALPGAAKGMPQSANYKGNFALNGQTIEGTVDARLAGRPNVTAELKTSLLDLDKLRASTAAKPAAAPARGQRTAKAADKPIDTAALRGIDGSLKFDAATLVSSPLRLTNASLAATLKDGVLTLSHFKGALFGGTLDLSGVVDARQPALAFDLKGDANSIYVGEMLRNMSGKNTFGGAVKVTVDGKLNVNSITAKGSGATADQIKRSIAGGAQLSGHIFAGADKALTTLGTAATGVVGGVIDNALGSALGIVGQTAGAGVSNMLNAASLLLNRFVNRDNPISGRINISGGVVTDQGLLVQGDRATANIATRTDLATSTTDTRVNFVIAEDTSGPYVVATVHGPLASPSYSVSRGSAKDPPGFVNTLGNGSGDAKAPTRSILPNLPTPKFPLPNLFGR